MRKLIVVLATSLALLSGCGSGSSSPPATSGAISPVTTPGPIEQSAGRSVLSANAGSSTVAAVEALGPGAALLVYQRVARFSDADVALTGSVLQACQAIARLAADPGFGPAAVFGLLAPIAADDAGQSLLVAAAGTLNPKIDQGAARVRDSLTAGAARQQPSGRNPEVESLLTPAISSMPKFHELRELSPDAVPVDQRTALRVLRDRLTYPSNGALIQKIVKTPIIQKYLDGTFDPIATGFQAVQADVASLITPAQIIEGLRLDYAGGFQGETEVGALVFAQDDSFRMIPPYTPSNGGRVVSPYPFAGNGFAATVQANAVPEWIVPAAGVRLKAGAQLFLIDARGTRTLRGTFNGTGWVGPNVPSAKTTAARVEVRRAATYRGVPIFVQSKDEVSYFVSVAQEIDPTLLLDAVKVGQSDWWGRILVTDPDLRF